MDVDAVTRSWAAVVRNEPASTPSLRPRVMAETLITAITAPVVVPLAAVATVVITAADDASAHALALATAAAAAAAVTVVEAAAATTMAAGWLRHHRRQSVHAVPTIVVEPVVAVIKTITATVIVPLATAATVAIATDDAAVAATVAIAAAATAATAAAAAAAAAATATAAATMVASAEASAATTMAAGWLRHHRRKATGAVQPAVVVESAVAVDPAQLEGFPLLSETYGFAACEEGAGGDVFTHDQEWVSKTCDAIQRRRFAVIRLPRRFVAVYERLLQHTTYPSAVRDTSVGKGQRTPDFGLSSELPADLCLSSRMWAAMSETICREVTRGLRLLCDGGTSSTETTLAGAGTASESIIESCHGLLRLSYSAFTGGHPHFDGSFTTFVGPGNVPGSLLNLSLSAAPVASVCLRRFAAC